MENKNIIREELIGLNVKVVNSDNKSLQNIEGRIVNETKNTLVILCDKGRKKKTVIKKHADFQIEKNGKIYIIKGEKLAKRPEERIKI